MGDKRKMTKEELERQKWNDIFLEDCAVYDKKIAEEYTTLEEQIAKLKEENKELKEVHESDKRSLRLIAEKGANLEREISILLSCKNCPNNKGGYICEKEYEGKCLSQKIQYIKELQEENKKWKDEWQEQVQKANDEGYARTLQTIQLNKAKDHIKKLLGCLRQDTNDPETNYYVCKYMTEAEQFLKENE